LHSPNACDVEVRKLANVVDDYLVASIKLQNKRLFVLRVRKGGGKYMAIRFDCLAEIVFLLREDVRAERIAGSLISSGFKMIKFRSIIAVLFKIY